MKIRNFLPALLLAPASLHAATVILPPPFAVTSPVPVDGEPGTTGTSVTVFVPVATALVSAQNAATVPGVDSTATARGGALVSIIIGGSAYLGAQTAITNNAINFNTVTSGTGIVGAVVTGVVSAGLVPSWQATIDLTSQNLIPGNDYTLTFNLAQTSVLGNLTTAALLNRFGVTIGNSAGTFNAGVLGLTNVVASSGLATVNFRAGLSGTAPVLTFSGSALTGATAVPLFSGTPGTTNIYSVSAITISPTVPEPGAWVIPSVLGGLLIFRRKRSR